MPRAWQVMGILNVTPDSFYDGGHYLGDGLNKALARVEAMLEEGADIIDIGGESSRPGAEAVSADVEIARVVPLIQALHQRFPALVISIDTTKTVVARLALDAGASIINDISGFHDPAMAELLASRGCEGVLMHMQGKPQTMQLKPTYNDVVDDIATFFKQRLAALQELGVEKSRLILDPGIGFGKTVEHNLRLINHLERFTALGCRLMLGASRKSFLGKILGVVESQRLEGSLAAAVMGLARGARLFRVHDVGATVRALTVAQAIGEEQPCTP